MSDAEKRQPVELQLLDGKTYTIRPLTLGPLIAIYPKIEAVFGSLSDLPATLGNSADVVLAALVNSGYVDLTREHLVEDLLDLELVQEAFKAVIAVSGLKVKEVDPGKVLALVKAPPTGSESSATSPAPSDGPLSTSATT
jgi:hypothetical protein